MTILTSGVDHALGDAVVVINADHEDPPELIAELLKGTMSFMPRA